MSKQTKSGGFMLLYFIFSLALVLWGDRPACATTTDKTYDKNNVEKIKDVLIPPVLEWVRNDGWIIKTGNTDFEVKLDDEFIKASQKNEGKYDIDDRGILVLKNKTIPGHIYGMPFPNIDPKDPKAAQKLIENQRLANYRYAAAERTVWIHWIGQRGVERSVRAINDALYYQGRRLPIHNPSNFLFQNLTNVLSPFDLRGTVQMTWMYQSEQEDSCFAYLPMLRRIRRVTAASRSDPFLGSDLCVDDSDGWMGKNNSMVWKLIGKGNLLMPFSSLKKYLVLRNSDGSVTIPLAQNIMGYDQKDLEGVPWMPISVGWVKRPVWIVEANAKDPYYNYGKQIFYMDQSTYMIYFKIIYDRSGEYWKTLMVAPSYFVTPEGLVLHADSIVSFYLMVDDKMRHASMSTATKEGNRDYRMLVSLEDIGPNNYTESAIRQLSK